MLEANGFIVLLIGRIITGFGVGVVVPPTVLYISEISLIKFRGVLGILHALFR